MLYGWLNHHQAALLAVMQFSKMGGNSWRALTSIKLNFPYVYRKAVFLENSVQKYLEEGT